MDERKTQANKRQFYQHPVFVKWGHISTFLAYPHGLFASVPDRILTSGKTRSFTQDFGPNMNCILTFMVNHLDRSTSDGLDTGDKDIAQAFFGSQAYVQAETGMTQSAISRAFSSLVEAGVLIREGGNGKKVLHAFSERTINAILAFSERRTLIERAGNKDNKPVRQAKKTDATAACDSPGQSHMTDQTVAYDSPDSRIYPPYIEEPFTEGFNESSMDGCNASREAIQPMSPFRFIELCKEIDWLISDKGAAFADWEATQKAADALIQNEGKGQSYALLSFKSFLVGFIEHREKQRLKFKRSAPWQDKLDVCVAAWRTQLKADTPKDGQIHPLR